MRRLLCAIFIAATATFSAESPQAAELRRVAEVASVMLDGDVCLRIETPRSKDFANLKDPRDPWRYGDNYDVDGAAFNQTKKTLIRLSRLCQHACDVNLWMPVDSDLASVQIVIRNVHEISQFWKWGDMRQPMPSEMARVLKTATRVTVQHQPDIVSVLAPVFDSLNNVVGVAEVVGKTAPDPRGNVK